MTVSRVVEAYPQDSLL